VLAVLFDVVAEKRTTILVLLLLLLPAPSDAAIVPIDVIKARIGAD
jgi:hypothetical protein